MYSDGKTTDLIYGSKWTRNSVTRNERLLIEIQIDNATPEFQQLFKPSRYSSKDFNTNRRLF
jgi:hypothetical protein